MVSVEAEQPGAAGVLQLAVLACEQWGLRRGQPGQAAVRRLWLEMGCCAGVIEHVVAQYGQ